MSVGRTHENPFAPMGHVTARIAGMWFDLPEDFAGRATSTQPIGLLVGEQPRPGGNPKLPLWPWPPNCAGARLHVMSGMPIDEYLIRLARTNISLQPVARWNATDARFRATRMMTSLPDGARVIACGMKARNAFGLAEWFQMTPHDVDARRVEIASIPHPSGRNREYNFVPAMTEARLWIRWAAGVGELP